MSLSVVAWNWQYRVDDHTIVNEYPFSRPVHSVISTFDSKHAFVGLAEGYLRHFYIDSQATPKHYGKIHTGTIMSMAVTRDNNFLIASAVSGEVKKI